MRPRARKSVTGRETVIRPRFTFGEHPTGGEDLKDNPMAGEGGGCSAVLRKNRCLTHQRGGIHEETIARGRSGISRRC
jgi:hypothetical protein